MHLKQGGAVRLITVFLILILNAANVLAASYIHGNGELLAKVNESGIYYSHSDNLGSTSAITNSAGKLAEAQINLPYGELVSGGEKYGFTGKEYDETGLQYFGARYYLPLTGRFLTIDSEKDGLSWYSYGRNNPLRYVDPSGNRALHADAEKFDRYRHMEEPGKFKRFFEEYTSIWSRLWRKLKPDTTAEVLTDKEFPFYIEPTTLDYFIKEGLPALKEITDVYYNDFDKSMCVLMSIIAASELDNTGIKSAVILGVVGKKNIIPHAWIGVNIEGHLMYIDVTEGQFVVDQRGEELKAGPNTGVFIISSDGGNIGKYVLESTEPAIVRFGNRNLFFAALPWDQISKYVSYPAESLKIDNIKELRERSKINRRILNLKINHLAPISSNNP